MLPESGLGLPYFPIVDEDGVVYYGVSGPQCGSDVRLMRLAPAAGRASTLVRFPRGIDVFPGDVEGDRVFFGRFDCDAERGDIYRTT